MSSTTVKAIWPGEKVEELEELPNSWGSAPAIWSALSDRYLGGGSAWLAGAADASAGGLWALVRDPRLAFCERACLAITFDHAYIAQKDFARAACDIREFLELHKSRIEGRVNHWPAIIDILDRSDVPAIGFHMTSVSEDPWVGSYDEETDQHAPIDWDRVWSVYDVLGSEGVSDDGS